ncbi:MAG: acyl-homoserine-lactone synthase [Pseudolabrys sp.]|jgi:acyl homoserine lactone synthase
MHEIRKRVFRDRLNWQVKTLRGWEIDEFDALNPLYLISIGDDGNVRGSLRLLPTTGPNMLADVFPELLPDGMTIESATIWESSRFSVDQAAAAERSDNLLNRTTGELLVGIVEVGLLAGLTEVVSVYDAMFARILKRADCAAELIGKPARIGDIMGYAALFEISDRMLINMRKAAGITEPVLEEKSIKRLATV